VEPALQLDFMPSRADNSSMTVTADENRRVVLPAAQAGERFDVQILEDGKIVLTRLPSPHKPDGIRLVSKHGYTVAVGTKPITQEMVRAALDEFP
jgi:hypothetical protein